MKSNDELHVACWWEPSMQVRWAQEKDVEAVKRLTDENRGAFGFVVRASLEERVRKGGLLVAEQQRALVGFVSFHHRRDGWTTIHELCTRAENRKRGVGRALVQQVEQEALHKRQNGVRLKCPLDLPANGFYARLGFTRVGIEEGKRRPLAIWEKRLRQSARPDAHAPNFFLTLTHNASEIRQILRLWRDSADPSNPFAQVIFTPLFSRPSAINLIRQMKEEQGSVIMFDSGGYQVQMGKASYEELFDRLLRFYRENSWADWYVLPDHVPCSTDSEREVEFKVRDSIDFARLFIRMMPDDFVAKAIGVVHGRTADQVRRCIDAYAEMGIRYVGFGSFGTSGPNGTINLISQRSLRLLRLVQTHAHEHGMRVHIFGIGSPSHLIRLAEANITPASLDSAGWWKAGGFGDVFFSDGSRLSVSRTVSKNGTVKGIEQHRRRTVHSCQFCEQPRDLKRHRMMRVMHNLTVLLETVERLRWTNRE
jgi:N-acetylglutamate synthase-like GNAT family acetyltransferase